jgi:putative 4-mercaptohistidine N1-methyltranferase
VPANINLEWFASECPVDTFEWGSTGLYDVIGNVWQWTESPIDGLPGFKVHPLYDDFSTPTFDGKHTLFKGGSWISMGANGATIDARYSFRRHFFQHAGFRYVESAAPVCTDVSRYETDPAVLREIDVQYSAPSTKPSPLWSPASLPLFDKTCAEQYASVIAKVVAAHGTPTGRVLDLNCSVGRRTFELAKTFDECVGMDITARHIQVASRLQEGEMVRYTVPCEGTINTFHEVTTDALGLVEEATRCSFVQQPDLANLDTDGLKFGDFDLVVCANVLEKQPSPKGVLANVAHFVRPGGLLVIGSTYSWDAAVTPRKNWVGGYKCDTSGENMPGIDAIANELKGKFVRLDADENHEAYEAKRSTFRSMELEISEISVWKRIE